MISIQRLKQFVAITEANASLVQLTLDSVIADFETKTNRQWSVRTANSQEIRLDYDARRFNFVYVKAYPCIGFVSLTEWEEDRVTFSDLTRDVDYSVDTTTGTIENLRVDGRGSPIIIWGPKLKATLGDTGYANDAAPADVISALGREVALRVLRNVPDRMFVLKQMLRDAGSVEYGDLSQSHPEFNRAVNKYRNTGKNF